MTSETRPGRVPLYNFWQPRYWWMWLLAGLLRLLTLLPYRAQMWLGRCLGRAGYHLIRGRRRIAEANIGICFPELSGTEQRQLVKRHFESLGMGVFEIGVSWWASDARIDKLISIEGFHHVQDAQARGKGVVILSGHFSGTELTGRVVALNLSNVSALYRPTRNQLADQFLRRGREAFSLIPKDGMRQMIRSLRSGGAIWYAADQFYARKYHEMVPFFGEPAMTNAALTQIARISDAVVVPYVPRRRDDYSGYDATFLPPLEDFPGENPAADATRMNELLEQYIRRAPEQYLWIHRRFKGRPDEYPDPYDEPNAVTR